jgi:hypothetical protein
MVGLRLRIGDGPVSRPASARLSSSSVITAVSVVVVVRLSSRGETRAFMSESGQWSCGPCFSAVKQFSGIASFKRLAAVRSCDKLHERAGLCRDCMQAPSEIQMPGRPSSSNLETKGPDTDSSHSSRQTAGPLNNGARAQNVGRRRQPGGRPSRLDGDIPELEWPMQVF